MPGHDRSPGRWRPLSCDGLDRSAPDPGPEVAPLDPDVDPTASRLRRGPRPAGRWGELASIAVGGALGAEARYGLGLAIPHQPGQFPVGTLLVNASGCLLIGVLMVLLTELTRPHLWARPLLGVGFLGGYTTFSTYSTDLVVLWWHTDQVGAALAYLVATPIAALFAAWAGTALTRMAAAALANREGTA